MISLLEVHMQFGMPTLIENKTLEENIALCKELGLNFIELNMNFPEYQTDRLEDTAKLIALAEEADIYYTIHLDENLNIADFIRYLVYHVHILLITKLNNNGVASKIKVFPHKIIIWIPDNLQLHYFAIWQFFAPQCLMIPFQGLAVPIRIAALWRICSEIKRCIYRRHNYRRTLIFHFCITPGT